MHHGATVAGQIHSVETCRLLQLDHELHAEGDRLLSASGLGQLLRAEGFAAVGSYTMGTMTWRDLDFERTDENPDWGRHWQLGTRIARSPWVWKFSCHNAYAAPGSAGEGLYWGLRLSDPAGGPVWKMDLWTARAAEFTAGSPHRARWSAVLNQESRVAILAIKQAVCQLPEYRHQLLSVHIYEAVLDHGVKDLEQFERWRRERSARP